MKEYPVEGGGEMKNEEWKNEEYFVSRHTIHDSPFLTTPFKSKGELLTNRDFVKGRFQEWRMKSEKWRIDLIIILHSSLIIFHYKDSPVAQLVRALHW